jgi:hypothetical protein
VDTLLGRLGVMSKPPRRAWLVAGLVEDMEGGE